MKWILRLFLLALVNLFIVAPAICHFYAREKLAQLRTGEEELRASLPKFIADLQAMDAHPVFPDWRRSRNAEPFLSEWISWEGEGAIKLDSPAHRALRELFAKHPQAMKDERQFSEFAADPLLNQVETRWMEKIADYDHWHPTLSAKVLPKIAEGSALNSIGRVGVYATLPVPDYTELRQFAFAHFVKLYRSKRTREGLTTFRKAAELMHTSGSLIGGMSAAAMLLTEPALAAFAHEYSWPVLPPGAAERYRRLSWTWTGYVNGAWIGEFPQELWAYLKPQNGLCSGAGENIASLTSFSDFFEETAPLELNFKKALARSRDLQMKVRDLCGQPEFGPFIERTTASANPLILKDAPSVYKVMSQGAPPLIVNPARLPYVRRVVGLTLMTVAAPDYLRFYRTEGR